MPSRDKESYSIQAVENALDVLEALSEIDDDVRISQLSEKLAMNKTSVFRLLATFENRGYVEREELSGKYRLGRIEIICRDRDKKYALPGSMGLQTGPE